MRYVLLLFVCGVIVDVVSPVCRKYSDEFIKYRTEVKDGANRVQYTQGGVAANNINHTLLQCQHNFAECKLSSTFDKGCLTTYQLCDGKDDCLIPEDEHKCSDTILDCYRKQHKVRLKISEYGNYSNYVKGADLKACAKLCLETRGCWAFGYLNHNNFLCDLYLDDVKDRRLERNESWSYYFLYSQPDCDKNQFRCSPSECIQLSWICDGEKDCSNGDDEALCDISATSFEKSTKSEETRYYFKDYLGVTYAGCARFCHKEPLCTGFYYASDYQECYLKCELLPECPSIRRPLIYPSTYYSRSPLSLRQALKLNIEEIIRDLELNPESNLGLTKSSQGNSFINNFLRSQADESEAPSCYSTYPDLLNEVKDICGKSEGDRPTESGSPVPVDIVYVNPLFQKGGQADAAMYPWQVQIRRKVGTSLVHQCGGAIITKYHIISAAHCVSGGPEDFQVVVGQTNVANKDPEKQEFDVADLERPVRYKKLSSQNSNDYDVAIITIQPNNGTAIKFGKSVKPICLPCKNNDLETGEECEISGFGKTVDANRKEILSTHLIAGSVQTLSQEECRTKYHRQDAAITSRLVCAGGPYASVCRGDSGGPLACKRKGRFSLMGVVHRGTEMCNNNAGVFIRVAKFIDFITREINVFNAFFV